MAAGGELDRAPCLLFVDGLKCRLAGASAYDYWHDAETIVRVETEAFERWGHDLVVVGPNSLGITEALGGAFSYPAGGMPLEDASGRLEYEDLDTLEPPDPRRSPRLRPFFDALDRLVDALGARVSVEASIGGPMTVAAFLRGTERLLRDFMRRPEEVARLLRVVEEVEMGCIDEAASRGAGVYMADPVANPALIGRRRYERYVYPLTRELTEHARERCGRGVTLHMCGRTEGLWDLFGDYPLRAISLDNAVDLGAAVAKLGRSFMVAGNVDPVGVIARGDAGAISADVERCVRTGEGSASGFSLAPGCDVPIGCDLGRIDEFMDACLAAGWRK